SLEGPSVPLEWEMNAVSLVAAVTLRRGSAFLAAQASAREVAPLGFRKAAAAGPAPKLSAGAGWASLAPLAVLAGRALRGRHFSVARRGQSDISLIDFRVGEIKSCEKHPESDKLLVEQIDIGEEVPRQICSGIGAFFEPDQVVGKKVVIVSNLKARKMAGTASEGMLLCASKSEGEELRSLDLVQAPEEAPLGERIVVEVDDEEHGEPAAPNRVGKKKLYEKVAGELKTNADGTVCFKDSPFMTSAGPCTAKAMPDAVVS
ncbi:unnamed protein product, partial [Effrenium voratum]